MNDDDRLHARYQRRARVLDVPMVAAVASAAAEAWAEGDVATAEVLVRVTEQVAQRVAPRVPRDDTR